MLHWMTVGYVSDKAKEAIIEQGGKVEEISHDPAFLAVALAYDPAGYWSWSRGQRQHRSGIEFWNSGEIQMEHITLEWGPRSAECHSVETTYLICPWEEFDTKTMQVKVEDSKEEQPAVTGMLSSGGDFDPFLDSDELP